MAQKRAVKSKEEAKEQQANEAIRRKAGRVNTFRPMTFLLYDYFVATDL